ncbi:Sensor histidine kinase [hydrothermal vent metagenome]|uniref:histidine kinase n=1 Tax=hydrothermal vent metagenome TaxID=652676 RepID=A0A1W1E7S0_9ZZZZ
MKLFGKPHLTEYVLARVVTVAIVLFVSLYIAMLLLEIESKTILIALAFVAFAFTLFIYIIWRGARRMEKELNILNRYLRDIDSLDKVEYRARFFTKEFEQINKNLIRVLRKAKKREDIKQRYNTKLKLKNRQRADMLSAITHEFRNPIAAIMGYAQTLQDDRDIPPALREKFLEKIYNNGNKIESLLGRLMLWNKFESGEATLHKSRFDLCALTKEVKRSLLEKYKTREIVVSCTPCSVEADRTLIEVVLKNLIENALKYSKEAVEITIENNGYVSVRDHGVGISKSDLEKVTKKFYRSGTHNWDNSMGLGLSIVKTILKLHGSSLDIESRLGEGSTFSFAISPKSDA